MPIDVEIKVIPKAHKTEIVGFEEGILKIRVKAVPEKGEANEELIAFLAKVTKCPKSSILLVGGKTGRRKKIRFLKELSEEVKKEFISSTSG